MSTINVTSGYSSRAWREPEAIIEHAEEALRGVDFDTFVCQGLSGMMVAPMLARHFGKHLCIVRKRGEHSHGHHDCEGYLGERWVFVDDFISGGRTLARCKEGIKNTCANWNHTTTFVGSYLYQREFDMGFFPEPEPTPKRNTVQAAEQAERLNPIGRVARIPIRGPEGRIDYRTIPGILPPTERTE